MGFELDAKHPIVLLPRKNMKNVISHIKTFILKLLKDQEITALVKQQFTFQFSVCSHCSL